MDITASEADEDPWLIARLETGFVRLNPNQYYRGALFFVAKRCVAELHELERAERDLHLREMAEVAHALFDAVAEEAQRRGPRPLGDAPALVADSAPPR